MRNSKHKFNPTIWYELQYESINRIKIGLLTILIWISEYQKWRLISRNQTYLDNIAIAGYNTDTGKQNTQNIEL